MIFEDFDDGAIDPADFALTIPSGFEINFSGGAAEFVKLNGTGNGFARLTHTMTAFGDFEISVVADLVTSNSGVAFGLVSSHLPGGTGFTDIYYRNGILVSNFVLAPISQPTSIATPTSPLTLRIRRVGEQVFHEYDDGGGFQELASATHANLASPFHAGLFLGEEANDTTLSSGTFDDLSVMAERFSPLCGNGLIAGDELCDDGDGNGTWQTGEYCSASCEIVACGDPDDSALTTATDALFVLRTSVALASCDVCVCDVNNSGGELAPAIRESGRRLQRLASRPAVLTLVVEGLRR